MPEINPYEPPQTENLVERADAAPFADDLGSSLQMLFSLQAVFLIAIQCCLLLQPEPKSWLSMMLRSVLACNALTAIAIAALAFVGPRWRLLWLEFALIAGSCYLLYYISP